MFTLKVIPSRNHKGWVQLTLKMCFITKIISNKHNLSHKLNLINILVYYFFSLALKIVRIIEAGPAHGHGLGLGGGNGGLALGGHGGDAGLGLGGGIGSGPAQQIKIIKVIQQQQAPPAPNQQGPAHIKIIKVLQQAAPAPAAIQQEQIVKIIRVQAAPALGGGHGHGWN